jgi:DNA-binding NarL/FixJ family response regulator
VQVPPVPPAELAELTPRELEVLRELGKGRSNAEIGQPLFISETTVRTHINRSTLGLRDRVQAVVYAYEAGLIRVGDAKGTT